MSASILVVEDNPDNRKLITWLLEDEDFEIVCAETAEEGIELIEQRAFDLVLMDVSLPGMRGDEATKILKGNPRFKDLPIIAVTAHAVKGEHEKILASGVSALVTKPIDEDELLDTIRSFLNVKS